MKTAACVMVKNEEHNFLEWICFHLAVGFDAILVYENNSTDRTARIALAAREVGDVRVRTWGTWMSQQDDAYQAALQEYGHEFDWIACIDSDEFLFSPEHRSINDVLRSVGPAGAVAVNWQCYGSSGITEISDRLVIEQFTRRAVEDFSANHHVKSILNTRKVKPFGQINCHRFELNEGEEYFWADGRPARDWIKLGKTAHVEATDVLRINHYYTRSRQQYDNKIARGRSRGAKVKDDFDRMDRNEVLDDVAKIYLPEVEELMDRVARVPPVPTPQSLAGPRVTEEEGASDLHELERDNGEPCSQRFEGAWVSVGPAEIGADDGRVLAIAATSVMSPNTSGEKIVGEKIRAGRNRQTWLKYETIDWVFAVRRSNDKQLMKLAKDYTIDMSLGLVTNLSGEALDITYVGFRQRLDVIGVDPETGAVVLTQGLEHPRTAEAWAAELPPGQVQIARVYRTGSKAVVIPTWRWKDGVHVARREDHEAWRDHCRSMLPRTVNGIGDGSRTRVIAYGDGSLVMGVNTKSGALNLFPNGDLAQKYVRDIPSHFGLWDTDSRKRMLDQNVDLGDGFGAIHSREGLGWAFLKNVAARHDLTFGIGDEQLQYRNWALGNTNTGRGTAKGDNRANALEAVRWKAVRADVIAGETLVLLSFRAGERAADDLYDNMVELIAGFREVGAEVLVIAPTRPDPRFVPDLKLWSRAVDETVRAARHAGAAYVDTTALLSPENLCGLGIAEQQLCSANNITSAGKVVLDAVGRAAASIF